MEVREPIPDDLKRKVRQQCGFGCVICGSPIYDYDHIEEYATVQKHTFENLVLLCPTCHRKKTNGLITKDTVRTARENPSSQFRTSSDNLPIQPYSLNIGGNVINTINGLVFNICEFGWMVIRFSNYPLIYAEILDENGERAVEIRENNYTLCARTWDIEYVGKILTFRNGPRKIFASLMFDIENRSISVSGNIKLSNDVRIKIQDNGIYADDQLLAHGNQFLDCGAAIIITDQPVMGPYLFSGRLIGNIMFQNAGIAGLNSIECKDNHFFRCQIGFVWTKEFLSNLNNS